MAMEETTVHIIVGGNPQTQIIYGMRTLNRFMILRQMYSIYAIEYLPFQIKWIKK